MPLDVAGGRGSAAVRWPWHNTETNWASVVWYGCLWCICFLATGLRLCFLVPVARCCCVLRLLQLFASGLERVSVFYMVIDVLGLLRERAAFCQRSSRLRVYLAAHHFA